MKQANIIFFGPPGAGKGTQAKILSENQRLPHIDTGSLIREAIKKESELGNKAKGFVEAGKLVPDDLVIALIKEKLSELKNTSFKGFILDGYPRTIPQAEALENMLDNLKLDKPKIINIQAPENILIKRLSSRRICSNKTCGEIYNLVTKAPEKEGKCDKCSSDLYQRKDDTEKACTERLNEYRKKTALLEEYYNKQNSLVNINGTRDPYEVCKFIIQELGLRIKD